jgi:hypothetical protein
MAHPYYQPKVVGKITLPDAPQKHKCVCDDCGNEVNDSFGDPRVSVRRVYSDGTQENRMICPDCEFDIFQDTYDEPKSIFD